MSCLTILGKSELILNLTCLSNYDLTNYLPAHLTSPTNLDKVCLLFVVASYLVFFNDILFCACCHGFRRVDVCGFLALVALFLLSILFPKTTVFVTLVLDQSLEIYGNWREEEGRRKRLEEWEQLKKKEAEKKLNKKQNMKN